MATLPKATVSRRAFSIVGTDGARRPALNHDAVSDVAFVGVELCSALYRTPEARADRVSTTPLLSTGKRAQTGSAGSTGTRATAASTAPGAAASTSTAAAAPAAAAAGFGAAAAAASGDGSSGTDGGVDSPLFMSVAVLAAADLERVLDADADALERRLAHGLAEGSSAAGGLVFCVPVGSHAPDDEVERDILLPGANDVPLVACPSPEWPAWTRW